MIDTNFNNVFLWNNGQKIFVGTSNGLKSRISIYERNNPYGTSWTKLSNVAQLDRKIYSLVVNQQGTTIYATTTPASFS